MVERMELRLGEAGARRLAALAKKLELPKAAVVRMAIRQMAEREGVEEAPDTQEAA